MKILLILAFVFAICTLVVTIDKGRKLSDKELDDKESVKVAEVKVVGFGGSFISSLFVLAAFIVYGKLLLIIIFAAAVILAFLILLLSIIAWHLTKRIKKIRRKRECDW